MSLKVFPQSADGFALSSPFALSAPLAPKAMPDEQFEQ